ncbi:hypothetical protein QBC34DRAFT_216649 [Podospora aff. communis PSN243]|uniref:Oxidoreductase NAD-binding domain-containing protein 1 n=1 Tax=Podospora aff. communis PSN243 TaxID=3040156 RepID=A0AAV9H0E4_9PEZI|nr:hypothetical protein QBC34DRAFT_216649 [Podospora aff. communis PSN243]
MSKESHTERTAAEPRDATLHSTTIASIEEINPNIRIFRLALPPPGIKFLPGQWLDVHLPPLPKPGGFTITSTPFKALLSPSNPNPHLELAIQRSPSNPAATYLYQPPSLLLNTPVSVRVGGSFVFPPPGVPVVPLRRVVFVAGGVGVNPLVSMLCSIAEGSLAGQVDVRFLYSTRDAGVPRDVKGILFLERIAGVFKEGRLKGGLRLFLTGCEVEWEGGDVKFEKRRIRLEDVEEALDEEKEDAVVYVCGLPSMTDEFVDGLVAKSGMEEKRVLSEKWW